MISAEFKRGTGEMIHPLPAAGVPPAFCAVNKNNLIICLKSYTLNSVWLPIRLKTKE
jgi:hypothetical protein